MKESYKYPNPIYSIQLMMIGKKKLRKKLFLTLNWEILKLSFLVCCEFVFVGAKSNKYFRDCPLTILYKTQSFRNHCLFSRDSNPSS